MTRPARTRPARTGAPRALRLPQLLAAAVEANPGGDAVVYAGAEQSTERLTYAELDARSSRLARSLIARGIGPEDLVAIGIRRSVASVLAVWAVAKTGAGFVPVDPNYPADRVRHMLTDCGATLGLTVSAVRPGLSGDVRWLMLDSPAFRAEVEQRSPEAVTSADRVRSLRAGHPAYVIYTSGSTGSPKGVVVTQAGLAGFCAEQRERYGVDTASRTLHFASPSFDASVLELLLAVGGGAAMVVADPAVYGGDELARLLRRERVTHAFVTPAALASVQPAGLDELRVVIAGGEACPPELVRRWATGGRAFHNGYGPTETTIMTNISAPLRPGEAVTIGAPIRGVTEFVLDERLVPVPAGVAGELYIAGAQLARGYHRRPGLTAGRFVPNPFAADGSRLYRTGDLVRATPGGAVEYLGRTDFQVQLRGFRIELGEIEAALAAHPAVAQAVALVRAPDRLVGYVVPAGAAVDPDELRDHVAARLPSYMVPATLVVLDRLPLTGNGKLDRAALPEPVFAEHEYRAPRTELERALCAAFAEVLKLERVGLDDHFFACGGNSLLAVALAGRLERVQAARVPVAWLFAAPTPAQLAERLAAREPHRNGAFDLLLPLRPGGAAPPLFCFAPAGGMAWSFAGLAAHLERDRPLYGLQSPALAGAGLPDSLEEWARLCVRELRAVQPAGPYHLLGWSLGGVLAHAVAVELQRAGEEVALLGMLDSSLEVPADRSGAVVLADLLGGLVDPAALAGADPADLAAHLERLPEPFGSLGPARLRHILEAGVRSLDLVAAYRPHRFDGDLVFFSAAAHDPAESRCARTWTEAVTGAVRDHPVRADHWHMTAAEVLPVIAEAIAAVPTRTPVSAARR
ncbi:amino acid adenylation domain-containing protein [Nocardia sp. NPDC057353]|uniref:amino acid adenylation domain-containing protein n=1 Tax=Nocardia sp. NPDC057353 TaxID=3346104 RepID=UPI0036314185